MSDDLLRQRDAGRHQKRRPVDGVEAHDVFADEVDVGRPIALELLTVEFERRDVVRERVHPDVDDVIRRAWERNAPGDGGARDRQILQTLLDERDDLVHARGRIDEVRILPVVLEQRLGEARELEKEIALGGHLDGVAAFVLAVADLIVGDERFLALAVPAGVLAEVDVIGYPLLNAADQFQDAEAVALLGGADEIVVADVELAPHLVMLGNDQGAAGDGDDDQRRQMPVLRAVRQE